MKNKINQFNALRFYVTKVYCVTYNKADYY